MKFAIVCPYDLSMPGGVKDVVLETHKRLIKRGHESTIISVNPQKKVDMKNAVFFGTKMPMELNKTSSGIDLEWLKDNQEIKSFFDSRDFDYVCIHEPAHPFLNWEVLLHSKSANIGIFHSTSVFDINKFPYNLFTFPFEDWIKSKLNGFVAVSPSAEKTWKEVFKYEDGLILGDGVDIERFRGAKKIKLGPQLNILFVGRLDQRKGVLDAIKMVPLILKILPATLWVIGKGEQKEEAEKLVESLGIKKNVVFVGRVSDEDLPKYYKSADVFCAPSIGGESFGIVLVEAMAAGIPIVAYANDGYKFPMEGNIWKGGLVGIGSYKGLAKSVLELANSNHLREKVLKWQNEKVKEFDWERIVDRLLEYLGSLKCSDKLT